MTRLSFDACEFLGELRAYHGERYLDAIWFMREVEQHERQKQRAAGCGRLNEMLRAVRKAPERQAPARRRPRLVAP